MQQVNIKLLGLLFIASTFPLSFWQLQQRASVHSSSKSISSLCGVFMHMCMQVFEFIHAALYILKSSKRTGVLQVLAYFRGMWLIEGSSCHITSKGSTQWKVFRENVMSPKIKKEKDISHLVSVVFCLLFVSFFFIARNLPLISFLLVSNLHFYPFFHHFFSHIP